MTAPIFPQTGQPVDWQMAVMVAWDDVAGKYIPVQAVSGALLSQLVVESVEIGKVDTNADGPIAPGAVTGTKSLLGGGKYTAAGVTLTDGQQVAFQMTSDGRLMVGLSSAGPVAPGTAAGKSNLKGGIYSLALPTATDGQQVAIQLDANGRQLVAINGIAGAKGVGSTFFNAAFATLTRPANTTAYSANDSVSDNATAGSVTALSATVSDTNDNPISIERVRVVTTDTGVNGVTFRAWLYNSDPTASSGVGGGDNAAFSNKKAGYIGTFSGTFRSMSDGCVATLTPDEGSRIVCLPTSGAKTIYIQYQTLGAFTPSANSTTFIGTAEGFQGRT